MSKPTRSSTHKQPDDQTVLGWLLVFGGLTCVVISIVLGLLMIQGVSKQEPDLGQSQLLNRLTVEQAANLIIQQTMQVELTPLITAPTPAATNSGDISVE